MAIIDSAPDLSFSHPRLGRFEARNQAANIIAAGLASAMVFGAFKLVQSQAVRQLRAKLFSTTPVSER